MHLNICKICGGDLIPIGDKWQCKYCGNIFYKDSVEKDAELLRSIFDEQKRERIANLRNMQYKAVTANHISSQDVISVCTEIKKLLPNDFLSEIYECACKKSPKEISAAIRKINAEENYEHLDGVIVFLTRALRPGFLVALKNLIERAYKARDLERYNRYITAVEKEAEKLRVGLYETSVPRDVFIAYSSKDMDKVDELVEFLEEQKFTCFLAARNLRHGAGSVENYSAALEDAMLHCKAFVFVSTLNSRSFDCDALKVEIPFIRNADINNAPGELRQNYTKIPRIYKKPRVEYRLEESVGYNVADTVTKEFFDGYEWVYTPEAVAERLLKQHIDSIYEENRAHPTSDQTPPKTDADIATLLKRAHMSLEDSDFARADEFCEKVLNQDPENAEAYLGKLMAELRVCKKEQLQFCRYSFDGNANYKRVIRYGSPALQQELKRYIAAIQARQQQEYLRTQHVERTVYPTVGNTSSHTAPVSRNVQTPPPPQKKTTLKNPHLFPIRLLVIGLLLTFIPFFMYLIGILYEPLGNNATYYNIQIGVFKANALIVTVFLCITYMRKYVRDQLTGGFVGGFFSYLFTYNLLSMAIYFLACPEIGEHLFGSADRGSMLYNWVVYIYLFIVVLHDNYKIKNKKI